jgi:hypothetical protein
VINCLFVCYEGKITVHTSGVIQTTHTRRTHTPVHKSEAMDGTGLYGHGAGHQQAVEAPIASPPAAHGRSHPLTWCWSVCCLFGDDQKVSTFGCLCQNLATNVFIKVTKRQPSL